MVLKSRAGFNSGLRIENWSYSEADELRLTQCVGVVEHLKRRANIPLDQPIWDNAKVAKLVVGTKKRKAIYFLVFGLAGASGLAGCIFLVLTIACIFDGKQCSDVTEHLNGICFSIALVIASGSLIWLRKIGRNLPPVNFEDFLSEELSEEQKNILVREIRAIKNAEETLYELGSYEKFRKIDAICWRAQNWFLLLTENDKDRSGIWLDKRHPAGKLYMKIKRNNEQGQSMNVVWEKIYLENTRYIYSNLDRLNSFIEYQSKQALKPKPQVWLEGFKALSENRDDHINYLNRTITPNARVVFFDKLTRVLAKNSNRYKKEVASNGVEGVNYHDLGGSGATRLLHGQNENIEKWIKNYLGNT